uniref:Uncharacterized protein n=1 Tax=Amphora coffeiformis TaxID=265554 RepID=A0A6S8HXC7_9STRA|mmetsp:Transcript_13223/g.25062  ORF Transcript_13223/g.25062 Transcript_13223/m.25062 type:complete len:165 (+) Transcript_13223:343-837(+)|eukprot:scaffold46423_cov191-Amphora_coffeaeformis.AAC.1
MCRPTSDQCVRLDSLHLLQQANGLASAARMAYAMAGAPAQTSPLSTTFFSSPSMLLSDMSLPHIRFVQLSDRQSFLLFIKVLLKYLEKVNEPQLRRQVKSIVAECVRRNRQGNKNFTPLPGVIELLVRSCVGDLHWKRARLCLDTLCEKRHWRAAGSKASVTAV